MKFVIRFIMRQIFFFISMVIVNLFNGISYIIATINIPLSNIPFFVGLILVWIIETIAGIFVNLRGSLVHIYAEAYREMIDKLKKKKYDELYSEMNKRKKTDKENW